MDVPGPSGGPTLSVVVPVFRSAGILRELYTRLTTVLTELGDDYELVLVEDGGGDEFVHGVTPGGAVYKIARNALGNGSEFAGACFSPDGSTLFVNIQTPGITLAISGPWHRRVA